MVSDIPARDGKNDHLFYSETTRLDLIQNLYKFVKLKYLLGTGRVACLPSIPVFSLIFSFLSITKTVYDLNILPLVSGKSRSSQAFFISLKET